MFFWNSLVLWLEFWSLSWYVWSSHTCRKTIESQILSIHLSFNRAGKTGEPEATCSSLYYTCSLKPKRSKCLNLKMTNYMILQVAWHYFGLLVGVDAIAILQPATRGSWAAFSCLNQYKSISTCSGPQTTPHIPKASVSPPSKDSQIL